jgi:hypothetical protein
MRHQPRAVRTPEMALGADIDLDNVHLGWRSHTHLLMATGREVAGIPFTRENSVASDR